MHWQPAYILQWHFQVKETDTALCQDAGEHFPPSLWGHSQSTEEQSNTRILKIRKLYFFFFMVEWVRKIIYLFFWKSIGSPKISGGIVEINNAVSICFFLCCLVGDGVRQCGRWVQTQRSHVLLQKPQTWGVDHGGQPSLQLLPVPHVRQHHGAQQPAQVSPATST